MISLYNFRGFLNRYSDTPVREISRQLNPTMCATVIKRSQHSFAQSLQQWNSHRALFTANKCVRNVKRLLKFKICQKKGGNKSKMARSILMAFFYDCKWKFYFITSVLIYNWWGHKTDIFNAISTDKRLFMLVVKFTSTTLLYAKSNKIFLRNVRNNSNGRMVI